MSVNLPGIRMGNNQGLVTITAGNDLCHILSRGRKAVIRKIMAFNTGGNVTLQFGTLNATPAFVALLPIFVAIGAGMDTEWLETEIPYFEFELNTSAGAAYRLGDIYVLGSIATVTLSLEIEEFGA